MQISGHIINIRNRGIFDGIIDVAEDRITKITESSEVEDQYILPDFIDAHVHIESSMVVPSEFA